MAIVVEEKRNRLSPVTLAAWIAILIIIVVAVYFIFFKEPDRSGFTVPPGFSNTQKISGINLNAQAIVNSEDFTKRSEQVSPPEPGIFGRPNPFIPF